MQHDRLRIPLHRRSDSHQVLTLGIRREHNIGGGHTKLARPDGNSLSRINIWPARLDRNIEADIFVIAADQSIIEASMFRLGIPIGKKTDRCKLRFRSFLRLGGFVASGQKQKAGTTKSEKTADHQWQK